MKKLVISTLFVLGSANALAGSINLVSSDESPLSQLCIAATEGTDAMLKVARENNIGLAELDRIACNNIPLHRFASRYQKVAISGDYVKPLAVNLGDSSPETELCVAAISSPSKFQEIRRAHFADVWNVEESVSCNGMPLNRFVRKFGNRPVASTNSVSQR